MFSENTYDIGTYYFDYSDYEIFFPRYQHKEDTVLKQRRKNLQGKILEIHDIIYPEIELLGISSHRRKANTTSSIRPEIYNHGKVSWIGVRYGKTPHELDALKLSYDDENDYSGFQKHGCLQYCIMPTGFDINLFLAVKNDAWDRAYLHENISKKKKDIENQLRNLKGYEYFWRIYDDILKESYEFVLDDENVEDFIPYFKKHDKDGRTSCLSKCYSPDDPVLKDLSSLSTEILIHLKRLLPLYNTLVHRIV